MKYIKKPMKSNGVSMFEKGDLKKLSTIRNKLRFLPAKPDIFIVQPRVSASTITEDMHQILCGAQAYLLDTYGITLQMICSQQKEFFGLGELDRIAQFRSEVYR